MRQSWLSSSLLPGRERASGLPWGVTLSTGVCLVAALALAPLFGWALAQERWIIIALLAMVGAVPLVIRWPIVSTFGLYAFFLPFDSVATLSNAGGTTLTRLLGILACVVLLAAGLVERRLVRPPWPVLWWSLFMVWAVLTIAWAMDPDVALQRLPLAFSVFLLYLVAVCFRPTRQEFYWVCLLVVVGGGVAAAMGYVYGLEGAARASARGTLAVGERSANPNAFGAALLLPLALAAGGFVGMRNALPKLLAVGALGVIGMGIYATRSRGALVALILTMLVFVYRSRIRWQALVPIAMLLAVVLVVPETFFARATRVVTGEDATGAGRTEVWSVGLAALEHVGIFGAGLANYRETFRFTEAFSTWEKGAHNTFLGTWVELGIVGLVLLLAALASHLVAVRSVKRGGRGGVLLSAIEAACFGMLASAFFGDRLWLKFFWLPWILLTWAIYIAPETEQDSNSPP